MSGIATQRDEGGGRSSPRWMELGRLRLDMLLAAKAARRSARISPSSIPRPPHWSGLAAGSLTFAEAEAKVARLAGS